MAPTRAPSTARTVVAATSGNVLEWYDFVAYGFLAPLIADAFFPSDNQVASLLGAFGALAAGYAARPVGSVIFGHIGDRIGRKPALLISVLIMGAGTVLIGALPTYAQIGIAAPILLVVLRCIQGISVAGEYASSGVLLTETSQPNRRGLMGSWIVFGMTCGCLLGSGVAALISNLIGETAMQEWGWRLPFLLGSVIAVFSLILRWNLPESPAMVQRAKAESSPMMTAIRTQWRPMLAIVGLILPTAIGYFLIFTYATSFLTNQMHFTTTQALDISTLSLVVFACIAPIAGYLSDRVGRKPLMYATLIGTLVLAWPLWTIMHQQDPTLVFVGQAILALINGIGWAMTIPMMVEMLPAKVRVSAVAGSYNICLAIFGGTTPWVATYLVQRTSDDYAPVIYWMAAAAIALVITIRLPEMARKPLS